MKSLILASLGLSVAAMAMAETGVQSGTKYGTGEDSIRCIANVSTFTQFAKSKSYGSMHESWSTIMSTCPASTQRAYTDGSMMLKWEIQQATDVNKKKELFNQLMNLHDQRIKYFGKVKKYPTYYILGRKAHDYIAYSPALTGDDTKTKAYQWLAESIEKGGENCEPEVFQDYFTISDALFKANPTVNRETYIADYMKISPILNAAAAKDSTYNNAVAAVNKTFARSGAAECSTLDKAYSAKIDANKNDTTFLKDVLKLYRIAGCKESAVYFKGSAYLHAINPSAQSAAGMADQALTKKDYANALKYYNEAIKLSNDRGDKSDCYYNIAYIYSIQKNYQASRSNALSAISMDPSCGKAYVLIATLYASGASQISDDAVLQKTAYWAAVDKLEKAIAVDPSLSGKVRSMINTYKAQYPDKSELFMRGVKGGSYTVPGWINETTTVR